MYIINLFGGPCSGKSTTAAGLFYFMKKMGVNVELVTEWIKDKVYEQTPYPFEDELYTFAKQQKKLRQLKGKVDYVITDSPIILPIIYSEKEVETFGNLVMEYFNQYNNINFLLRRDHLYTSTGRREKTAGEADAIHRSIVSLLTLSSIPYKEVSSKTAVDTILQYLDDGWLV